MHPSVNVPQVIRAIRENTPNDPRTIRDLARRDVFVTHSKSTR